MKRIFFFLLCLIALAGCVQASEKTTATTVSKPTLSDRFIVYILDEKTNTLIQQEFLFVDGEKRILKEMGMENGLRIEHIIQRNMPEYKKDFHAEAKNIQINGTFDYDLVLSNQDFQTEAEWNEILAQIDKNMLAYENYVKENIIENQAIYQKLKQVEKNQPEEIQKQITAKRDQLFVDWKQFNKITQNKKVMLIGRVTDVNIKI